MAGAAGLAAACPKVTFVLQHAGMLEDLSAEGRAEWREGMKMLAGRAERRLESSPASAPSSTATTPATSPTSRARRSRSSGRSAASSARTFRSRSSGPTTRADRRATATRRRLGPDRGARFFTKTRAGSTGCESRKRHRERRMALEIKVLDYGDIELESSFLVLGRGCGRTRRVPAGLPDPRRALADRGRYRLSLQRDHGNARHARAAVPREHDREPARPPRRADGRRALRLPHASAHRPRRQGRPVPDEHHGRHEPAGARVFGLRPDAPAISQAGHQASDRPAAHRDALRLSISRSPARSS